VDKRITCVALFEDESVINRLVSTIDNNLCKVPMFVEDRKNVDTLPYHVTLCVWNINDKDKIIEIAGTLEINEIELEIDDIKIKKGNFQGDESLNLYLSIKENEKLKKLQQTIYEKLPNTPYNPSNYIMHISLHSNNDLNNAEEIRNKLMESFQTFKIKINKLALYEIYPAKRIL